LGRYGISITRFEDIRRHISVNNGEANQDDLAGALEASTSSHYCF